MKSKPFSKYYLFSCIGVLVASYYPLSMGVRVIVDMLMDGFVLKENYPKYIIPYTPICIAVIIGVLLMPACMKVCKRFALAGGATIAVGVFFLFELLFEREVVVATAETVSKLEDWQMFMCYIPPGGWGDNVTTYKTQTAVDILMGDYNPAFKMHFYIISIVLVISILNCLYGFGQMIRTSEKNRCKALVLQAICTFIFLGLCILACFTAFWRDGSIQVSPLSAALMTLFFILLGVTAGIFVGSFLMGKCKFLSIWIPTIVAFVMTLLMYIGEMILLNGHLYNFGAGFLFNGLPGIILAPIDLLTIIVAASLTALIFALLNDYRRTRLIFAGSSVVVLLVVLLFAVILLGGNKESIDSSKLTESEGSDESTMRYSTVQVLEKTSGAEESTYRVGASLPSTDFSSIGKVLEESITKEWETYDNMSVEQRMISSKLWGVVGVQTDTWSECEETIGFAIYNPLESLDWLSKTGYFGMESMDPDLQVKHVQAIVNTAKSNDKKINEINITAGYNSDSIRITLAATLSANSGTYVTGSACNGYATYEQNTVTTKSGIPVLIVTTNETNNNGYYHGDYFDPTAYWVKDNVFYTLRVFGDEIDKTDILEILERILEEI